MLRKKFFFFGWITSPYESVVWVSVVKIPTKTLDKKQGLSSLTNYSKTAKYPVYDVITRAGLLFFFFLAE